MSIKFSSNYYTLDIKRQNVKEEGKRGRDQQRVTKTNPSALYSMILQQIKKLPLYEDGFFLWYFQGYACKVESKL